MLEVQQLYWTVGNRVATKRNALNLTQQQVADKIGIHRSALSAIESGKQKLTIDELLQLCSVFKCPPDELLPLIKDTERLIKEQAAQAQPDYFLFQGSIEEINIKAVQLLKIGYLPHGAPITSHSVYNKYVQGFIKQ